MIYQTTFKRFEIKYILTLDQRAAVLAAMEGRMKLDRYGRSSIRNIYFDTDDFRLVRRSIERPIYKEKLRVRSYGTVTTESAVFVELKKKFDSVVYKRRLSLPEGEIMEAFAEGRALPVNSQIGDEIEYMREYYGEPKPKVYLSYDREAYQSLDGTELRITFDENIKYRTTELSLCSPPGGTRILAPECALMEVKTAGAMPLWLTHLLTQNRIFKTSYSKYGTAYEHIFHLYNFVL